jgi:hypothetical protein
MITDSLMSMWLKDNDIDIIILTGNRPYIDRNIPPQNIPRTIILSSEVAAGFQLPLTFEQVTNRTIRYVRKSGAYIGRL